MLYFLSNLVLFVFITFLLSLLISTSADSSFQMSFMLPCMRVTHGGVFDLCVCIIIIIIIIITDI